MINCQNCGGLNFEGNQNCSFCGASLINYANPQNLGYDDVNNQNTIAFDEQQMYNQSNTNQYVESFNTNYDNNDVLIDAYIGKNAEKIKNSSFSIWALFFGTIYIWYRKMYKVLALWFGLSFIVSLISALLKVPVVVSIFAVAFNIFFGIKFNSLYMKNVSEKVEKIRSQNSDISDDDLVNICSKKGGTTIIPIVVSVLLTIGVPIILATMFIRPSTNDYLDEAKKASMIDVANMAIGVVESDIITNDVKDNSKVYNIDDLNSLLEKQLVTSPFNKSYVDARVQIIKTMDGSYLYRVCLLDDGNNGFGYTISTSLDANSVLVGNAPSSC